MFDLGIIRVEQHPSGPWITFRCLCDCFLDETRAAWIPYVSVVDCRYGHQVRYPKEGE